MHALAREIQQGQASQGQRNILSSSISLCFLQPSFVVCHGKNSNESLSAAGGIPVRRKPVALSTLFSSYKFSVTLSSCKEGKSHQDRLNWHWLIIIYNSFAFLELIFLSSHTTLSLLALQHADEHMLVCIYKIVSLHILSLRMDLIVLVT